MKKTLGEYLEKTNDRLLHGFGWGNEGERDFYNFIELVRESLKGIQIPPKPLNVNDFQEILNQYKSDDIEAAQDRDYDLWIFDLKNRIQELYDEVFIHNKATKKRKAAIDVSLVQVQIAIEKSMKLLNDTQ
ncbi:hypothetical protein ACFQZE_06920 [Paenibacillus sp. GCM10027627]|uniref:hypothetical protein n=1 Tax=unclassified Paenibacillus TaxID=185978 RepID=UPI00362C3C5B